jgi:signal transduction histidine kinase/ligand-binding sensor domain-containing protein
MFGRLTLVALMVGWFGWGHDRLAARELGSVLDSDENYRVTRWTAADGLPQNSIKAMIQDRDGYLWLGTLKGLARFDGTRFKVFDHGNTPELAQDSINELVEDENDGLWINARNQLLHYGNYRFECVGAKYGIAEVQGPLAPAVGGGVWFSPRPGKIGRWQQGKVEIWEIGPDVGSNNILQLGEVAGRGTYALMAGKLFRLDLKTGAVVKAPLPPRTATCYGFLPERDGRFWLYTDEGLCWGHESEWTRVRDSGALPGRGPVRIYKTSDDRMWVVLARGASPSGLEHVEGGRLRSFTEPGVLANLETFRFLEDREGNVWVGTATSLLRLQRKHLKVFSRKDRLAAEDVVSAGLGVDDTIWVSTAAGVSAIRNGKVTNLKAPDPTADWGRIGVLLPDRSGSIWVGWEGRLWRGSLSGKWESIWIPAHVPKPITIRALYEDREGKIWISTGEGIISLDPQQKQWSYLSGTNGLPHPDVRVIYQDRKGEMWFGTFGGGLARLRQDQFTSYKTTLSSYNNRAWWIHEDVDGVFWVGSEDGLNRFENGKFFTYTTAHGLGEDVVNNIQEDDFGNLWLSGLRGIYRVTRNQLNQVAKGARQQVDCTVYGEADGMLNSECNGGDNQPAGCKDSLGRIWFPTVQGLVMIDPRHIRLNTVPPTVIIQQVIAAENEVVYGDNMPALAVHSAMAQQPHVARPRAPTRGRDFELTAYNAERIEILFTATSLVAPEKVRFKYVLRGFDREWHTVTDRRSAVYTNLRPGDYRFEVYAANPHGIWNPHPARIWFSVTPHFWQSGIFYGICAAALVGFAAAVQAYRLRWQRRLLKLEQQRALATERTRIARDLHDDLGTALTGLALELDVIGQESGQGRVLGKRLELTAQRTRQLAERMREVVWTVNPRCDTVSSLADFLEQQVEQFLHMRGVQVRLDFPEDIPPLPLRGEARHQLALSVREALTNIERHAEATEVQVGLRLTEAELVVTIRDNGQGFHPSSSNGDGLNNMRTRLEQVGGSFECDSAQGRGTVVTLRLPLQSEKL